jgi:hypothetical protein
MTVKYRLNFVMSADVLFGLLARVLPVEELNVEEIAPVPVKEKPARITHDPAIRFDKRFDAPKPKRKPRDRGGPNLKAGANAIIMDLLSDGESHKANELNPLFKARGLSENGVGSALEKLRRRGLVHHPEVGLWAKTNEPVLHSRRA